MWFYQLRPDNVDEKKQQMVTLHPEAPITLHSEAPSTTSTCAGPDSEAEPRTWWDWWRPKLIQHFLPLGFAVALILGLSFPWLGATISSWKVHDYRIIPTINLVTIFIISGIVLKTKDVVSALKAPMGFIFGMLSILAVTPLLGLAVKEIPFSVPEFGLGLAIFCAVPTTLSAGVALVQVAGGNWALGLLLCVCSNAAAVATMPFMLRLLLSTGGSSGSSGAVSFDVLKLLVSLLLAIVAPLLIAKTVRDNWTRLRRWGQAHATALSLTSNASLIAILWQSISRAQAEIIGAPLAQVALLVLACAGAHSTLLLFNTACALLLRLPRADAVAVVIMTSQKTLPVSIAVIAFLPSETYGRHGLLSIPCILGHILQIFLDSFLAARVAAYTASHPPAADGVPEAVPVGPHDAASSGDGGTKICVRMALRPAPEECIELPHRHTLHAESFSSQPCSETPSALGCACFSLRREATWCSTCSCQSGSLCSPPIGPQLARYSPQSSRSSSGALAGALAAVGTPAGSPLGSTLSFPQIPLETPSTPAFLGCARQAHAGLFDKPTAFAV
eukprot:jgi/Ulvmu1/198/UM001_0202.1